MPPIPGKPVKVNETKMQAIEIFCFGTLQLKTDKNFLKEILE
jgi:hypothetical protein